MYDVGNVLGIKNAVSLDFSSKISKGLSFRVARRVQNLLAVPDRDFARILGISISTLRRLKKRKGKLSFVSSDRLYRLAYLFAWAVTVLEKEEAARRWLSHPQFGLGGQIPLKMAHTEIGSREVEGILSGIEHGTCL